MMNIGEDLRAWFGAFGIDDDELTVYMGLLQNGQSLTSVLSSKLNIERNKVYRSLLKLRNMGLVSTTFTNPVIFEANDIKSSLSFLIKKKESEVMSMKKLADFIVEKMGAVSTSDIKNASPRMLIIQGRSNIYAKIGKILENASNEIYIITTHADIINMYYTSIPEKIRSCKERNIRVKIISDKIDSSLIDILHGMNTCEIRIGKQSSKSRIVLEAKKSLIMSDLIKESIDMNYAQDSILYTTSCEMITHMEEFCQYLWKKAKRLEDVIRN